MRLPGSEKMEIIHLVEQSHLPARRTLEMLGIHPGGNRRGPAASYNNWEGGFHPTVFWMIKDAERT